jgi:hypothetical protein
VRELVADDEQEAAHHEHKRPEAEPLRDDEGRPVAPHDQRDERDDAAERDGAEQDPREGSEQQKATAPVQHGDQRRRTPERPLARAQQALEPARSSRPSGRLLDADEQPAIGELREQPRQPCRAVRAAAIRGLADQIDETARAVEQPDELGLLAREPNEGTGAVVLQDVALVRLGRIDALERPAGAQPRLAGAVPAEPGAADRGLLDDQADAGGNGDGDAGGRLVDTL